MKDNTWGMARINWRFSYVAYVVATIGLLGGLVNYVMSFFTDTSDNESLALGNYLLLLPVGIALFVCARNFRKLMHLGGRRMDFFRSGWITFTVPAVMVSAVMVVLHWTLDRYMVTAGRMSLALDLLTVFGFADRGIVIAFLQMLAWTLAVCSLVWTLALIQGRWYGWLVDVLLIVIISVGTPVASLRVALVWFFDVTIFGPWAIQVLACLVLAAAVYAASLIPIRSKSL